MATVRFPHNGRKSVAAEEGFTENLFCFSEAERDNTQNPLWSVLTIDRMTKAGTAPMATYPNSSTSLYLQIENTDLKR